MLIFATLALVATTVALPPLQSVVVHGAERLLFGLSHVSQLAYVASLLVGHLVLFILLALVCWLVPNGRIRLAAVWRRGNRDRFSSAVGTAFPISLARISNLAHLGNSVAFAFVALIWFYAQALALLAGAVVNSLRLGETAPGLTTESI